MRTPNFEQTGTRLDQAKPPDGSGGWRGKPPEIARQRPGREALEDREANQAAAEVLESWRAKYHELKEKVQHELLAKLTATVNQADTRYEETRAELQAALDEMIRLADILQEKKLKVDAAHFLVRIKDYVEQQLDQSRQAQKALQEDQGERDLPAFKRVIHSPGELGDLVVQTPAEQAEGVRKLRSVVRRAEIRRAIADEKIPAGVGRQTPLAQGEITNAPAEFKGLSGEFKAQIMELRWLFDQRIEVEGISKVRRSFDKLIGALERSDVDMIDRIVPQLLRETMRLERNTLTLKAGLPEERAKRGEAAGRTEVFDQLALNLHKRSIELTERLAVKLVEFAEKVESVVFPPREEAAELAA